jgi:hypothetical protein
VSGFSILPLPMNYLKTMPTKVVQKYFHKEIQALYLLGDLMAACLIQGRC